MLDLILNAIGALLEFVWTDWRPTPRQRVKRALRLSRKRNLHGKHRDFAVTWLSFGLKNFDDLRLGSREPEIRNALELVSRQDGR
jgi:hypothetical protein